MLSNLDNILKSRDITLSTKVCLVKAMVFPVVMDGCESWTIMEMGLGGLRELVMDRGGLACCSSWGRKESDTTERLSD